MHRFNLILVCCIACGIIAAQACIAPREPQVPFAIAWSYDTSGYLETCGCSAHQLGGLARRATLISELRAKQPVLAIEGAHIVADAGEFQLFKGQTIVAALSKMGYNALQLGIREAQHGADGIQHLVETATFPCFSANLVMNGQRWEKDTVVVKIGGARVGITGVSQPEAVNFELPAGVGFSNPREALDSALAKLRRKCDLRVICLEGEPTWVEQMKRSYASQADLFLSGSRGKQSATLEFSSTPPALNTWDEGRYLGWISVDPAPKSFTLAGKNLPIDEHYADAPEIKDLLDNTYRPQLKERFFGALKVDLGELYLPPDYCTDCHEEQVNKYLETGHAKALQTLVDKGQEYNPDCMFCHVVYDPDKDELQSMNCVVCHSNITDQHVWDAINELPIADPEPPVAYHTQKFCEQCHDPVNSAEFAAHWPQYVNKMYHGGDNAAAKAAAIAMGLDYTAPPPAHE